MCGIAGIVGQRRVNPAAVQTMTQLQAHRGPDGEGLWCSDDHTTILGHRRLAILDLSTAAAQPMHDGGGRFVLTYNGEIYNYLELRSELRALGAHFATASDSEVIIEAYRAWGVRCVEHFNGMFAFALLDRHNNELFCARDRFGEKPFLFSEGSGYFAFASEYKALLALAETANDIDPLALIQFLTDPRQGLDDHQKTIFRGICQLLPGETLQLNTKTLQKRIRSYWVLGSGVPASQTTIQEAARHFGELLKDAVRLRFRSDVSVGSCLSGGLDSSAIVCLARALIGVDVPYHVFTGRFPGTDSDEGAMAALVATHTDSIAHEVMPSARGFLDELPDFIWHNELPVSSSSQYAQWCVFRLARDVGVTVLLDGQGADELLGGYEHYFINYLQSLRNRGDHGLARGEAARIRARYEGILPSFLVRARRALPLAWTRHIARVTGRGSQFHFGISAEFSHAAVPPQRETAQTPNDLTTALTEDAGHKHLPTLLRYGDRNSMAHSREVRLPFCDHRIAEFVLSLDPALLMGNAETKRLLRAAFSGQMPERVRTRWRKQGFLPPQAGWFRDGLASYVEEVFSDSRFVASGLWEIRWWRRALARFKAGESHLAWTLWKPLIASAWDRHFVDRTSRASKAPVFLT